MTLEQPEKIKKNNYSINDIYNSCVTLQHCKSMTIALLKVQMAIFDAEFSVLFKDTLKIFSQTQIQTNK